MSPSSHWSSALTSIASTPPSQLPDDVHLRHDEWTVTIYDGFEKAKPLLGLTGNGKLTFGTASGSSKAAHVPGRHLKNLEALLASPHADEVLSRLKRAGEETAALIREEMPHVRLGGSPVGRTWGVNMGFHAVPSMETVHLHVISDDLVSDRLKNKKHYLSFKPDHGFFLSVDEVLELVRGGAKGLPRPPSFYDSLLRQPLVGRDGRTYRNVPELKVHLTAFWQREVRVGAKGGQEDGARGSGKGEGERRAEGRTKAMGARPCEPAAGKTRGDEALDDSATEEEEETGEPVLLSTSSGKGGRGRSGVGAERDAKGRESERSSRSQSASPQRKIQRKG